MAAPPSTPPPRTAQGCRLSSRLVTPELLLDKAHSPSRRGAGKLGSGQEHGSVPLGGGGQGSCGIWGWTGAGPPGVTSLGSAILCCCFLFCGVILAFLLVLGAEHNWG